MLCAGGCSERRAEPPPHPGKRVYLMRCASCHGSQGDGSGAGFGGKARSFLTDDFRTAAAPGEVPSDAALERVIREGIPGTSMAGSPFLREDERRAVIGFLKAEFFSKRQPRKRP